MRSRVKLHVTLFALICALPAFVGVAYAGDEKEKTATDGPPSAQINQEGMVPLEQGRFSYSLNSSAGSQGAFLTSRQ